MTRVAFLPRVPSPGEVIALEIVLAEIDPGGRDRTIDGPQEDYHEAAGPPSGDFTPSLSGQTIGGAYRIQKGPDGRVETWCRNCNTQLRTMSELFNHSC